MDKKEDKTKDKTPTNIYERENSVIEVYGQPNITRWTKLLMQIEQDIVAGRYKNKDENKEKPTDD
ncbi:hypothetical protein AB1K32_02520 [Metabacillus dongyingensis]|uniref:hypothetical protein n=1 Tax=Metabacillus dongyingensis TaxID=2874282 RepID=UPI003B8D450A